MRSIYHQLRAVWGVAAACLLLSSAAWAQRGGERSLLDLLDQQEVQTDLQLTAEQLQQLEGLRESLNDRSGFRELIHKAGDAESPEERAQLREEMQNYAATRQQGADEKLKGILADEQMTRLGQVSLQLRGMRALGSDDVAGTLNLTEPQQQQIETLFEEQLEARRGAGPLSSDEEREQFRAEWERKFSTVLTAEQRQQWAAMTGPPLGESLSVAATDGSAQVPAPQDPQPGYSPPPAEDEVVSSFGAASAQAEADTAEPAEAGDGKLSFSFRHAPWADVLVRFADAADLTLDLKDTPPGTFDHFDDERYTVTEALDIINGYLLARGYILIRRDKFLVSINVDDGIPPNLVPAVTVDELPDRGRNELMRVSFSLPEVEDIDALAESVEELKGPQGTVTGIAPTHSLVVTDIGSNLMNIYHMIKGMTEGPADLVFKSYSLQHVYADDAEFIVRSLLGLSTDAAVATATSAANDDDERERQDRRSRFSRFGGDRGRSPFGGDRQRTQTRTPTTSGSTTRTTSKANTIADPRTNKLFVTATLAEHRIVEETLKMFDVAESSPLASDRPFGGLGDKTMTVIPLANMDPTSAAVMLQSMYAKEEDDGPTISADLLGRQLIIRGTEAQVYSIKQLLTQMGEDGTGRRSAANSGPVRSVNLGGRDASELLPILERMWKAQHGSNIRVVTPADRDEDSRRRSEILRGLEGRRSQAPPQSERPQRPGDAGRSSDDADDNRASTNGRPQRGAVILNEQGNINLSDDPYAVGAEVEDSSESDEQAPAQSDVGGAVVQQFGDELMIVADDPATAEAVEQMLERIMRTIPPQTTWSIFPLTSADATEASLMLQQLFPDSRVSQTSSSSNGTLGALTSGISSFGSGVADLTGLSELGSGPQTLRIIPEVRLNALFVSGPSYKVQEVEEMLKIIDSSGLTDTNRDRFPRLIPVEFADIDDVFEIVSDVYAPKMQAPGGGGGNDPRQNIAAIFGGRSGRGGRGNGDGNGNDAQAQEPEVTLGVDRDTSHLIVAANDATFQEIEQLVYSIDQASQQANRTIMVRELVNTNASTIQNSLTSIMPKVTVSTSASTGRTTSSSSSSSNSRSSDADQRRAEILQRMRSGGGFGRGGFNPGGDTSRGGFSRGGGGFNRGGGGGDRGGRGR